LQRQLVPPDGGLSRSGEVRDCNVGSSYPTSGSTGLDWEDLSRMLSLSVLVHQAAKKRVFVSANQNATENLLKAGLRLPRGGRMGELC
jgi:hypothetical protein